MKNETLIAILQILAIPIIIIIVGVLLLWQYIFYPAGLKNSKEKVYYDRAHGCMPNECYWPNCPCDHRPYIATKRKFKL